MSFSSLVKNELCRISVKEKCCLKAELSAIVAIGGIISLARGREEIKIITENAAFARRTYTLFKELLGLFAEVRCKKNKKLKKHTSYLLSVIGSKNVYKVISTLKIPLHLHAGKNHIEENHIEEKRVKEKNTGGKHTGEKNAEEKHTAERTKIPVLEQGTGKIIANPCCRRAYLRGAFLASGSISDPEKTYHVELTTRVPHLAHELKGIIGSYNLNAKVIKRKGYYLIYLKEGDHIVDFLNIIGAHSALLNMENIRILKDMRNSVNRIVNCETANLGKTVNASVRQINNIEYIRDNIGFKNLPRGLREIAELRLQYRDASLKELGEMLEPPLGKSGVNHRLRRLEKMVKYGININKKRKPGKKA